ncbi:glycerophosphoryl diester phosphodiesterase [Tindallia californiensis]|uniref:Glycerophosphoryl diester phosphodiesterase n=1 Tax=Tindallia californiensis TaxID=159292 RepID=A0A1H3I979_9FIRM|nr:glycerophosphoryl diester phosphodiesterase [Tindallia californiensis]
MVNIRNNLLLKSLIDFKKYYRGYIAYGFVFLILTSVIFIPLLGYLFNRLIISMGAGVLINKDAFRIVLSYEGLIGLIIIASISVMIVFIELGGLIVLAQRKIFSKKVFISEAIITAIFSVPRIIGIGMLHFIFVILVVAPLIDIPVATEITSKIEVPPILMNMIQDSKIMLYVYRSILALFTLILLRWIFAVHYILLENLPARKAISCSAKLTEGRNIIHLASLLILNIIIVGGSFIIFSAISFIPSHIGIKTGGLLGAYILTFNSLLGMILAMLVMPINIIYITRLFYYLRNKTKMKSSGEFETVRNKKLEKIEWFFTRLIKRRRALLLTILMLNLLGTFMIGHTLNENFVHLGRDVKIAAHRGDPINAPENSMSAVRAALEQHSDFIEIDVQLSKDHVVILNHDMGLARVAGIPERPIELTYEELSQLDIGSSFSEDFKGETVVSLDEVLAEIKGKAKVIIDVKAYGPIEILAEEVVKSIERSNMANSVYVQSFDYELLQMIRKQNPDLYLGQILYYALGDISQLDVDYYAIDQSMLNREFIRNAKKDEREVWVWTVNEEDDIREVLMYDIDGIITDYVERVQNIIGYTVENTS